MHRYAGCEFGAIRVRFNFGLIDVAEFGLGMGKLEVSFKGNPHGFGCENQN